MRHSLHSCLFLGTDGFAATILERLLKDDGVEVLGVVTPPDARVGRKRMLTPCAVKQVALNAKLPIFEKAEELLSLERPDFLVVASYGYFLKEKILNFPKFLSLNVHASLLPKYRGASPIQTALLNGDRVSGVSVMEMVKKMDSGPVYAFAEVKIEEWHNAENLRADMAKVGAELLVQALHGIMGGVLESQLQDESKATYSRKITRESGKIDWNRETAREIVCKLKAYFPWPGVYTFFKGKRLKIHEAEVLGVDVVEVGGDANGVGKGANGSLTGVAGEKCDSPGLVRHENGTFFVETREGFLVLKTVQEEGKKIISVSDFARGHADFVKNHLTKS